MERKKIIELSKKNYEFEKFEKAKNILEKNYEISYGEYNSSELKKIIEKDKNPIIIQNHFIIGTNPDGTFVDKNNESIPVERMVKAIIIEDKKNEVDIIENNVKNNDNFAILGINKWDNPIDDFYSIFSNLKIGEIFLPPHSAVFNFLNPTEEQIKDKVASMLDGININIYKVENYIDNAFHEMGHLFWRTCLIKEEIDTFKEMFKNLKPSAIFEYNWETSSEEEVFCTVYKFYLKSLLLNKSFYNIIKHEEPGWLEVFEQCIERRKNDIMINDIFEVNKQHIFNALHPKFEKNSGRLIVNKEDMKKASDIEIPRKILQENIVKYEDETIFIELEKAVIPIVGNKIDFDKINIKK